MSVCEHACDVRCVCIRMEGWQVHNHLPTTADGTGLPAPTWGQQGEGQWGPKLCPRPSAQPPPAPSPTQRCPTYPHWLSPVVDGSGPLCSDCCGLTSSWLPGSLGPLAGPSRHLPSPYLSHTPPTPSSPSSDSPSV